MEIILTALALSMDSFTVSIATGVTFYKVNQWQILRIACYFSFFQILMPILGWLLGISAREYLSQYTHLIAFTILSGIGTNMIYECYKVKKDNYFKSKVEEVIPKSITNPIKGKSLLFLSLATSLDSLAVGVSIAIIHRDIYVTVFIIALTTFLSTIVGINLGKTIGENHFFSQYSGFLSGGMLIALGCKFFFDSNY